MTHEMQLAIITAAVTGVIAVVPPTIGILVVWLQNKAAFEGIDKQFKGVDERFKGINQRFDDMRELWRAELHRVEDVIHARLDSLEEKQK